MASSGFSPAGLQVLVVDADQEQLKNLEIMLKDCRYKVTTCNSAKEAVDILGKKNEISMFDIVLSDVKNGDIEGFAFLEYVSHNLKVPAIMMSEDGERNNVIKGIEYGACHYLCKPITMNELRCIWLHVFRKRTLQHHIDEHLTNKICENGLILEKKRKKSHFESNYSGDYRGCFSSLKKQRMTWTHELDNKFVSVVDQIGIKHATAGKIHKLMAEPTLTKEHVASHLQKYKEKMSKRAFFVAEEVSMQSVGLVPKFNNYNGITFDESLNFQNPTLQLYQSNVQSNHYNWSVVPVPLEHKFNAHPLSMNNHIVHGSVTSTSMGSTKEEQKLEFNATSSSSCMGDFNSHTNQNPHHLNKFGLDYSNVSAADQPHVIDYGPSDWQCSRDISSLFKELDDSDSFDYQHSEDISSILKEVGLDHWYNNFQGP